MQQDRVDAADRVLGLGLVARPDDEGVAAAADVRPLGDDVQGGAVAVGREEADRLALRARGPGGPPRAGRPGPASTRAEPFVVGDRRPFDRLAEPAGLGDGLAAGRRGPVVDRDADGDVGGVVADAALGDGLAEGLFEQDGVGDDLEPVGRPGVGRRCPSSRRRAGRACARRAGASRRGGGGNRPCRVRPSARW